MPIPPEDPTELRRFRSLFAHLGAVSAYARRRRAPDPDGIAAEVMAIAWQRLPDIPVDDPLPWLFATARNLSLAARRQAGRVVSDAVERGEEDPALELAGLSSELADALQRLAPIDREALLLIAWEGLTPAQAARVLGINPVAFRVRLHRARRRCAALLAPAPSNSLVPAEVSRDY
jgi:RNA polymerase sigma-70 factor (ECF subfamily)